MQSNRTVIQVSLKKNIRGKVKLQSKNEGFQQILELEINLQEWLFFKKGLGHVIFQPNLKLFTFSNFLKTKLLKIEIYPQQIQFFQQVYKQVLTLFPIINKFMLSSQIYQLLQPNDQQILAEWINKQKIIKKHFNRVFKIDIMDNINGYQFNHLIQVKPKTPLPEIYSLQFLEQEFIGKLDQIKNKFQLLQSKQLKQNPTLQQIMTIIDSSQSSQPVQKTRWFKKNCLKSKKKNENPLITYGVTQQQQMNYYSRCLLEKHQKIGEYQMSVKQIRLLNKKIGQKLQKQQIYKELVVVHSLCQYSAFQLQRFVQNKSVSAALSNLAENELNQTFNLIQKRIQTIRNQFAKHQSYKKYAINSLKSTCIRKSITLSDLQQIATIQKIAHIIQFLIALTWKDVSLMIITKIPQKQTRHISQDISVDFFIIDYGLKNISTIKGNVQKDKEYLYNFWIYKNQSKFKSVEQK